MCLCSLQSWQDVVKHYHNVMDGMLIMSQRYDIYPEGHCSTDREQLLLSILNTVSFPLVPRSPII